MPAHAWIPALVRAPIAARWDAAAGRRAATVVRRARRRSDVGVTARATAHTVEAAVLGELSREPTQWREDDRIAVMDLVAGYLAGVHAGDPLTDELAAAFTRLYQPVPDPAPEPAPSVVAAIADQYHRLYYHRAPRTWRNTFYRGHRVLKLPLDLWVYGEILHEVRPSLVVETGTRYGASALWIADQLELLDHGRVVTIDIEDLPGRPEHPRITHLIGSSTDPAIVEAVRAHVPDDGGPVLVILDSDHSREHVLRELDVLAPMVTVGSYVIVEDTDINGHPVLPEFGPGPMEAVAEFLGSRHDFEVDESREKYYVTQNPQGYLRRVR